MDKIRGYRTVIVAVAYIVLGISVRMGWTLDAATQGQADSIVTSIVTIATDPMVMGLVMALMRWLTTTPLGRRA